METSEWGPVGALVKECRERVGLTQGELADRLTEHLGMTVNQTTVSYNEQGRRWGRRPELQAAYIEVLGISEAEWRATLGYSPPTAIPRSLDFTAIVRADPALDEESKDHLINQYGLLRAATAHNRLITTGLAEGQPTREEIEAMGLPRRMKDLLLADLEAAERASDEEGDHPARAVN